MDHNLRPIQGSIGFKLKSLHSSSSTRDITDTTLPLSKTGSRTDLKSHDACTVANGTLCIWFKHPLPFIRCPLHLTPSTGHPVAKCPVPGRCRRPAGSCTRPHLGGVARSCTEPAGSYVRPWTLKDPVNYSGSRPHQTPQTSSGLLFSFVKM